MNTHEFHRIAISTILMYLGDQRTKGEINSPPLIRDWNPATEKEMVVKASHLNALNSI